MESGYKHWQKGQIKKERERENKKKVWEEENEQFILPVNSNQKFENYVQCFSLCV